MDIAAFQSRSIMRQCLGEVLAAMLEQTVCEPQSGMVDVEGIAFQQQIQLLLALIVSPQIEQTESVPDADVLVVTFKMLKFSVMLCRRFDVSAFMSLYDALWRHEALLAHCRWYADRVTLRTE